MGVSINTNDTANNTFSAATDDGHNVLHINKQSTKTNTASGQNAKYTFGLDEATNASKVVMKFDILINSDGTAKSDKGTFNAYIFQNTDYANTPYGGRLYTYTDGFTFGDTNATYNATVTNNQLGTYLLNYGEWYTVTLEIVTGGADEFSATWYVGDQVYGTSTNYWGSAGTSNTTVNSLYLWVQGNPTLNACIDNLTLTVYGK